MGIKKLLLYAWKEVSVKRKLAGLLAIGVLCVVIPLGCASTEEKVAGYNKNPVFFYMEQVKFCFVYTSTPNSDLHVSSWVPCTPEVIKLLVNPPPEGEIVPVTAPTQDESTSGKSSPPGVSLINTTNAAPASDQTDPPQTDQVRVRLEIADESSIAAWLAQGNERAQLPTSLAPGQYDLLVRFAGWIAPQIHMRGLKIGPGGTTLIVRCSSEFARCTTQIVH